MRSVLRPILTLRCAHGWSDGPWLGAGFALTEASERIVRGRHLLARVRGDALHVLAEIVGDAPRLPLTGASLRVALTVRDPAFAHYTAPASLAPAGAVARWTNTADAARLAPADPAPQADLLRAHPELRDASLAGVVDLSLADAFAASPPTFEVRFAARTEALTYCVFASFFGAEELAQLSVVDTAPSPLAFDRLAEGDLDPAWRAAAGGAQVVAFRSTAAVPRSASPRRGIELQRAVPTGTNGTTETVKLVAHLPAPGASPSVIVHVSK